MGLSVDSKQECRVAIVGAGAMAREHIRAFQDVPGVKILGIQSRTRSKAEDLAEEFKIPNVTDTVTELFKTTNANLVVTTVNETSTSAVAGACFEFPWTVFMEKPPGLHLKDSLSIQTAAQERKRRVFVALNRRFLSSTRAVTDDISKRSGSRYIHVLDQESPEAAAAVYGTPQIVLDNWMYANSIHLIDYFRIFGRGKITQVTPVVPWTRKAGIVVTKLEFDSGDIGLYEGVWKGPAPWAVSVLTPERRWEMRPVESAQFQNAGERKQNPVEIHTWDAQFKPGFRRQAGEVVKAALGESSESISLDEAVETMKLIRDIFEL